MDTLKRGKEREGPAEKGPAEGRAKEQVIHKIIFHVPLKPE